MNYLGTYFYFDKESGIYGNVSQSKASETYDRIIRDYYCVNTSGEKLVFFTNDCPEDLRKHLTRLGVEVFEGITLSFRNSDSWNTVTFIFDIMSYILNSTRFTNLDKFILTDPDVIITNTEGSFLEMDEFDSSLGLFSYGRFSEVPGLLQGKDIWSFIDQMSCENPTLIGGEFIAFKPKAILKTYLIAWRRSMIEDCLITEEQVLTKWFNDLGSDGGDVYLSDTMIRLWFNGGHVKKPSSSLVSYCHIHLPGEKEGLLKLVNNKIRLGKIFYNYRLFKLLAILIRLWKRIKSYS